MELKFLSILKHRWTILLKGKSIRRIDRRFLRLFVFRENEDEDEDENESENNEENIDDQMGDVNEDDQGETFDEKKWGDQQDKDEEEEEEEQKVRVLFDGNE